MCLPCGTEGWACNNWLETWVYQFNDQALASWPQDPSWRPRSGLYSSIKGRAIWSGLMMKVRIWYRGGAADSPTSRFAISDLGGVVANHQ